MDDVFMQMLGSAERALLESPPNEAQIIDSIDDLRDIEKPEPIHVTGPINVEVDEFDPTMNILDKDVKLSFYKERVGDETPRLTAAELTTSTTVGMFANVRMMEADWVKCIPVCKHILMLRCNFGEVTYSKFTPPERKKKIEKKKKPNRKKQGTGTEFNTQLTFVMNAEPNLYSDSDIIPTNALTFKIKVFRNGKIQLPGTREIYIDSIISSVRKIESTCNFVFKSGETDISKWILATNINLFMKNYKFAIKRKPSQLINLARLASVFRGANLREQSGIQIGIYDVIHSRATTNCSIQFNTPVYNNPDKKLRMTIEKSGKVNIKGGLYIEYSQQVFQLLDYILRTTSNIVVEEYASDPSRFNVSSCRSIDDIIAFWSAQK